MTAAAPKGGGCFVSKEDFATHAGNAPCPGAWLCEPQRADSRVTRKLVPTSVLLATRRGSQTRAPAKPGGFSRAMCGFAGRTAASRHPAVVRGRA